MASLSGVIIRLHTEGGLAGLLKYVPFCAVLVSHSLRGKGQLFFIKCVGSFSNLQFIIYIQIPELYCLWTPVSTPPAEAAADPEAAGTGAVCCSSSAGALGAGVAGACSKVIQGQW